MEDIEYLEEYRDLVLPALNSAAAAATSVSSETIKDFQKIDEAGDDSSSSVDQDIFNCLFDDNSEDDEEFNDYPNSGEKVVQKVEISRQGQNNKFNAIDKTVNKIISTVKPKTFMTKTSGTIIPLNTIRSNTTFEAKTKSIATVKPTVKNQKQNLVVQRQNPSTSAASTSARPVQLPVLARKHLPPATPLPKFSSINKTFISSSPSPSKCSNAVKKITKRPATIVKPEKIITKDPANDPLELDDLSQAGSDNYSLSDISGETYNSISDLEDDFSNDDYFSGEENYYEDIEDEDDTSTNSQVIELSNDSSGAISNLEDLRAPTPSPVISDDSDTVSNSGFKLSKTKSTKPYSHSKIIESVLRKTEKPKLLELLRTYNLFQDSSENNEGENIVIDITASRENLVESLDTQHVDSLKIASPSSIAALRVTTTASDSIDISPPVDNKLLTLSSLNNSNNHSKRTNKNKSKKKSVTNMDYIDTKSPGAVSTDSDLSAVEELLEESYAEAMKRVKDVTFTNQGVGAEMEIGEEEEVTKSNESKSKLPKVGVVIDYDDVGNSCIIKSNEISRKAEPVRDIDIEKDKEQTKAEDQKDFKTNKLLENETTNTLEIKEMDVTKQLEANNCALEQENAKENSVCKNENKSEEDLETTNVERSKSNMLVDNVQASTGDCLNFRRKKRFRNLLTPEPTDRCSEAAKSIDDIKDFEGFEESQLADDVQIDVIPEITQSAEKVLDKEIFPRLFRSPSSSNQSFKDKPKESKNKNLGDNSKESKHESSKHSKSKSSRHSAKERSSRHNSRDKSSRESSKDRSRSKDRPKHKDCTIKHNHKDHRKSHDSSKDSSKSRESSKSRDSKESKRLKEETQDKPESTSDKKDTMLESGSKNLNEMNEKLNSSKNANVKKDHTLEGGKKNISENKENPSKSSSCSESKLSKERDTKLLKEDKTHSEKRDNKPAEPTEKTKEKMSGTFMKMFSKEYQEIPIKETLKSSKISTKTDPNRSRGSSKERKNVSKKVDSTKNSQIIMSEIPTNTKLTSHLNKSVTHKLPSSALVDSSNVSNIKEKPIKDLEGLTDNRDNEKVLQLSHEESKSAKPLAQNADQSTFDTPLKKTPNTSIVSIDCKKPTTNASASKSSSKSTESCKRDSQKSDKICSSISKKTIVKIADQTESKASPKVSNQLDDLNKIKKPTRKKIFEDAIGAASKCSELSTTKKKDIKIKDTSATTNSASENHQTLKAFVKTEDIEKQSETTKTSTASIERKIVAAKSNESNKGSFSPKTIAKPKVEINKKSVPTNSYDSTKKVTTGKVEKSKPSEINIEEKRTGPTLFKMKDSQEGIDLNAVSEQPQMLLEKSPTVKHKNDLNKTCEFQTSDTKLEGKILCKNEICKEKKEKDHLNEKNYAPDSDAARFKTEKPKEVQICIRAQKEKEVVKSPRKKTEARKGLSHNDSTAAEGKSEKCIHKQKICKTNEKVVTPSTKPIASPKTARKAQKSADTRIAHKTDQTGLEKAKRMTKFLESTPKEELKDVSVLEKKVVKKALITSKLGHLCANPIKSKSSSPSAKTKVEDVQINDDVNQNKIGTQKRENLPEVRKSTAKHANDSASDTKPETIQNERCSEKVLKTIETPGSLKNNEAIAPARKNRRHMEHVLEKSVVILIEPLKLATAVDKKIESDVGMGPRRTRSQIDGAKYSESLRKTEVSTQNISESVDIQKPKRSSESCTSEIIKSRKVTDLQTETLKPENKAYTKRLPCVPKDKPVFSEHKAPTPDDNQEAKANIETIPIKCSSDKKISNICTDGISKEHSSQKNTIESTEKVAKESASKIIKIEKRAVSQEELQSESEKNETFQKDSCEESISNRKEKHESIKTKLDIRGKLEKESTKIINCELLTNKAEAKKNSIIKNRKHEVIKEEKETSQEEAVNESVSNSKEEKYHLESIKTRSRGYIKTKAEHEKRVTCQDQANEDKNVLPKESEKLFLDTKCAIVIKDNKERSSEKNAEGLNLEPTKVKKSKELKEESECSDKNSTTPNRTEEHTGPIQTRERGFLETEKDTEKTRIPQDQSTSENLIVPNKKPDLKLSHVKTDRQVTIQNQAERLISERGKMKKVESLVKKPSDDNIEHEKPCFQSITTNTDFNGQIGNDKDKKSILDSAKVRVLVPETATNQIEGLCFSLSTETRSNDDSKAVAADVKDEISQINNSNLTEKGALKKDLEQINLENHVPTAEDLKQADKVSCKNKSTKTRSISGGNENHVEDMSSKESNDDSKATVTDKVVRKHLEYANINSTPKTTREIGKTSHDSFTLENEMSGSECSITSSNSDNTLRRTLRKRGADSPLTENDTSKKAFKGPSLKSATPFSLTSAKHENAGTNVLISSSKRPSHPPFSNAESSSAPKKPKLDTSRKSSRFRGLHEDCLEEEELPIVTATRDTITKELEYSEQRRILYESKSKEPASVIFKNVQNKNTNDLKDVSVAGKKAEEEEKGAAASQACASVQEPRKLCDKEELPRTKKSNGNAKHNLREDQTNSKQDKYESVTKLPEMLSQSNTPETKVSFNSSKSSGSAAVISFSDWLKTKSQSKRSDADDNHSYAAKSETALDIGKSQKKLKPKNSVVKSTEVDGEYKEVSEWSQKGPVILCQNKEKALDLDRKHTEKTTCEDRYKTTATKDDEMTFERIDMSQELDNSLAQPSENQSKHSLQQLKAKSSNKKANIKRLQKQAVKIKTSPTKSNTPTSLTSPRMKKSEIDLLIESMSKEMKDGGISDLLKSETHVKRQRLTNKRSIRVSADKLKSNVSSPTGESPFVQLQNSHSSGLVSDNDVSVYFSETKRQPQQHTGESKRVSHKLKPNAEASSMHETPKVLTAKSRKSLNIKELPPQMETKSRKSMPNMSKGTSLKGPKKSQAISKSQRLIAREHIEKHENNVFLDPKSCGPSPILNLIPSAGSISKLYAEDMCLDSEITANKLQSLLKAFKCKKLRVQLDRSVVDKYLDSNKNHEAQVMARSDVLGISASPADSSSTTPSNSQTNLRIQTAIDASTMLTATSSTVMSENQDALSRLLITNNEGTLQDSNITSISLPSTQEVDYILPSGVATSGTLNNSITNFIDPTENIELKNEFMDENPIELMNDAILPDTPTLLARAQSITEAAQHALSNSVTPTDIRLITTDSVKNNFVASFGVAPTVLDHKGTCMYTFLHPAKYNRNHSNVLLDYCCPNLDGPMPAIDPTRIHAQVQVPVVELPSCIVLTTKVVTRADLERDNSSIPAIIRKKADKIRKNMATHHKLAVSTTVPNTNTAAMSPTMAQPQLTPAPRSTLPESINALKKQLPATTTITAKIRPTPSREQSQVPVDQTTLQLPTTNLEQTVASTLPKNTIVSVIPKGHLPHLTNVQHSSLRSNLRRFDVLLKQLIQPYENLTFVDRHRIIEAIMSSGKFLPKDIELMLVLMEEYIRQTLLLKNKSFEQSPASANPTILSTNNYITSQTAVASPLPTAQMPQLQPSPKILASKASHVRSYGRDLEQVDHTAVGKAASASKSTSSTSNTSSAVVVKQNQVPIYDTDRNIIGYQMRMITPVPMTDMTAYTKSTMSPHTGNIMATSLNSGSKKVTDDTLNKRILKRPAQDSPRVFYTTPPLKTSTPKAITNPHIYPAHHSKNSSINAKKTQASIVKTVCSSGSTSSTSSETITTTTTATVKRVTRSTATGSKIIIVSKSNQSSEETILPDGNSNQEAEQPEIKNEKDID